jgi:hypothetical protein
MARAWRVRVAVVQSRQRLRMRWRPHWRCLAVVAAPRSGADGIDRSIRITKSLLDHLVFWIQASSLSRHESSPRPRRAQDGRKCHAYLRAIRQPRLRWIVTAAHLASLAGWKAGRSAGWQEGWDLRSAVDVVVWYVNSRVDL